MHKIFRRSISYNRTVGSIALFCPEERIWKDNVSKLLGTSDNCGEKAYAAQEQTFRNEEIMWVNNIGDPSNLTNFDTWRGFSGAILERSNIQSMPFESSMSVGLGKHRFIEGEKIATQDWNNTGVQSILPTWRWWIENRGDLAVSVNWDDAYIVRLKLQDYRYTLGRRPFEASLQDYGSRYRWRYTSRCIQS